jgi:hypothetical protein
MGYTPEEVFTVDVTGPPYTALSLHLSPLVVEVGYSLKEMYAADVTGPPYTAHLLQL